MFLLFRAPSHASLPVVARCSYRFGTVAMETTGLPACIDRTRQRWEQVVCDWLHWPRCTPPPASSICYRVKVSLCVAVSGLSELFCFFFVNVRNMSNGHNLWAATDPLESNGWRVTVYISYLMIIGHAHRPKPKEEFHPALIYLLLTRSRGHPSLPALQQLRKRLRECWELGGCCSSWGRREDCSSGRWARSPNKRPSRARRHLLIRKHFMSSARML